MEWSPWTCYKFADFATRPGFVQFVGAGNVVPTDPPTDPPHFWTGGDLFDYYYPPANYDGSGTKNPLGRETGYEIHPVAAYTHPTPGTGPYLIRGAGADWDGNFKVNVGGVWDQNNGYAWLDRYLYLGDCGVFKTDLITWPYNEFQVALFHLASAVWWGVTFYSLQRPNGGDYDNCHQWEVWELTDSQTGNGSYSRIGRVRYRGGAYGESYYEGEDRVWGGGMGLDKFVVSRMQRPAIAGEPAFPAG